MPPRCGFSSSCSASEQVGTSPILNLAGRFRLARGDRASWSRRLGALSALAVAACSPSLNWREVAVGSEAVLLFPCKVEQRQRQGVPLDSVRYTMVQASCQAEGMTFAVTSLDLRSASPAADPPPPALVVERLARATAANIGGVLPPQAPASSTPSTAVGVDRRTRVEGRLAPDQPVTVEARIRVLGPWVIQAAVVGTRPDPQAVETFLDSLATRRQPVAGAGG